MPGQAFPATRPADPGLSSEFHCWPLPAYLWPALERRSQSIFCTEAHLRIHDALTPDVEAWVERADGQIAGLWLFRRHGRIARVLNEVAVADAAGLGHLADALFSRYGELDAIELHALHLADDEASPDIGSPDIGIRPGPGQPAALGYPLQRAVFSEDFVLELPASVDDWHASLSARTREKLRQALRRAQRAEPSFSFRLVHDIDITEQQVRSVLQMSRARMRAKGRSYGIDPHQERQLCALMQERGQLAAIEIDGHLRAGLLCTQAGNDLYMHVVAHDPRFDGLRLGYLCCVLGIEAAIAQGLHRFHFLWGWYDYKLQLGGQPRALHHALLWRSRLAQWRHPQLLLRQHWLGLKAGLRQRRIALRAPAAGHGHRHEHEHEHEHEHAHAPAHASRPATGRARSRRPGQWHAD